MLHAIKVIHSTKAPKDIDLDLPGSFVLKTCQRLIILTTYVDRDIQFDHELYDGHKAYQFLLETICGLKSRLQAEHEIVAQFKDAYSEYLDQDIRSSVIMKVLEKVFKDAKEIRSAYLLKLGQHSYTGIAKKIIQVKSTGQRVLILGSGKLARDAVRALSKKYEVSISARNDQAVEQIINDFSDRNVKKVEWEQREDFLHFDSIINTIGANQALFKESFFGMLDPNKHLFIDLGSPSAIETTKSTKQGVYKLEDIFNHQSILNEEKTKKIDQAREAIVKLSKQRERTLNHYRPIFWGELEFA